MKDRLRDMTSDDLDMVLGWRNHPDVRRWMYTQQVIEIEEHKAWFKRAETMPERHLLIYEQDEKPLGFVNLSMVDQRAARAEWGFYLAPEAPRGTGARLGACSLDHAFSTLFIHKLCGEVLANNSRSLLFHERLGFQREATLRHHFYDGHTYHDVIGFGLLIEDWHSMQQGTTL
ncbi:UDP-4-amino-4,6-dideoxy-N-acetyl-beta-L-altrosamine N-acetyltransferase [Kushneria phyllosphaerae]|uniref:Spermidine N(1)-acetyltransferase n=1 Tax=Kushneria phyllosphaerae TaxID=2100822 RepID=A0A2R8CNB5_9GAMM|nr:UDP-4-amino-4,6-dideoxy-N-acetyl-beta-L-altrosamine N-acetyltransferase [Kushneria phyllosphaerae]SPJ34386.1 Spermidine N(1)-acetyltransferase [Kushneria phyllosphaerae]